MIEKEILKRFDGKNVIFLFLDCGDEVVRRGRVIMITDNSLLVNFHGTEQAYSLDYIKSIRVDNHDQ